MFIKANVPTDIPQRPDSELFDRARTTAVELVRLVLTLATGTIAALSFGTLREPHQPLTSYQQQVLKFALGSLVLTVAFALVGVAADATADSNWALAIRRKENSDGHWYRRMKTWRRVRKTTFSFAVISFLAGICAAGSFVSMVLK